MHCVLINWCTGPTLIMTLHCISNSLMTRTPLFLKCLTFFKNLLGLIPHALNCWKSLPLLIFNLLLKWLSFCLFLLKCDLLPLQLIQSGSISLQAYFVFLAKLPCHLLKLFLLFDLSLKLKFSLVEELFQSLLFLSQQSQPCLSLPFGFVELSFLLQSEFLKTFVFNSFLSDSFLVFFGDSQLSLSFFFFLVFFQLLDPGLLFSGLQCQLLELHLLSMDFSFLSEFNLFSLSPGRSFSIISSSYSISFLIPKSLNLSFELLFSQLSSSFTRCFVSFKLLKSFSFAFLVFESLGSELLLFLLSKSQQPQSLLFFCSREFLSGLLGFC